MCSSPGLLLTLLALFAFTGCDNNPHTASHRETREDGSPWIVSYRNLGDDPRSLDPQVSYDTLGNAVISQVYEGLLQYAPYKTDPFELEPAQAAELPRKVETPDGRLYYEVRLKKGVRFHDFPCFPEGVGREVTAHDYLYAFQRIADPKVECPVLAVFFDYFEGIKEAYDEAKASGTFDYTKPFGPITVVDDHTFHINLKKPYPQLLYWLAMPFTAPVPKEAVAYYDGQEGREMFRFRPVGSGPYRLEEWARGRFLRLVRHPGYHATRFPESGWPEASNAVLQPLAGQALPFIDEVQLTIIRETIPAWLLFRQGYLDRFGVPNDVFNSVITAGQTLSEEYERRGVVLQKHVDLTTYYIQFNMEDPVIGKNVKLRRAISMAYDQERSNQIFRNGIDLKAEQILPPGMPGYDPAFRNPYREFDLEKAKAMLAEAGYPGGIDPKTNQPLVITLDTVTGSALARRMAEFSHQQLAQIGINCRLVENTWALFQEKMNKGNFQMNTGSGWHADYPDPENFYALFHGRNLPPIGHNNVRFQHEAFDRYYDEMAKMEDSPERSEIISKMGQILVEEMPIVPLAHSVVFSLSQPWVPRVIDNAMVSSGGGMKYQILDVALREAKQEEWNHAPLWPLILLGGLLLALFGYGAYLVRKNNL